MILSLLLLIAVDTTPVQALGQAPVVGGNRVQARERALEEALRQAVAQAIAYVLDPPTQKRASEALKRDVLSRARSYAKSYRVLDEREAEGKFSVQIEAQILLAPLRQDAQAAAQAAGRGGSTPGPAPSPTRAPTAGGKGLLRVLLLAEAKAAEAVRAALEARGFSVLPSLGSTAAGSDSDAAARARTAGADLVVTGGATASDEGRVRGTDQFSALARAELRFLDASGDALARGAAEARLFRASTEAAATAAIGEAASKAVSLAALELGSRSAPGAAASGDGVRVQVAGLKTAKELEAMGRSLGQIPGVSAIEPQRIENGIVAFFLRTRDRGPAVAQALRGAGLQVEGATEREVRVRATSAGFTP